MQDLIYMTTTVPLDMEHVRNLYTNRDKVHFLLDYKKSQLDNQGFLFYVSNLEIPGDILLNCNSQEKLTLLKYFMELPNMVNLNSLVIATMQVLLKRKNIDTTYMFDTTALTDEEVNLFIEQNQQLVDNWVTFFDSLYVFCLFAIYTKPLIGNTTDPDVIQEKLRLNPIRQMVPELNDPAFISPNFIYVMQVPTFLETYYSAGFNFDNMRFFTYQFTEYCYKGKNLFFHFSNFENWLLAATSVLIGLSNNSGDKSDDQSGNN